MQFYVFVLDSCIIALYQIQGNKTFHADDCFIEAYLLFLKGHRKKIYCLIGKTWNLTDWNKIYDLIGKTYTFGCTIGKKYTIQLEKHIRF